MNTFDDVWLSRYPRPEYIGFDNGGENKIVFEELVNNYGIKKKNSMPFNPQSNGIIERIHLTLNDSLRTDKLLPLPQPPRARPHGRMDKSKLPESHPTKACARACARCLNTEPNYY
jgi:transposase InsO family protein